MKEDSKFEGRDKAYIDVDRMTNEGLAGGTVTDRYDHPQIEATQDFKEEEPPKKAQDLER
ncbi:hypothetical protein H1D32_18255 [Anaerobacillus sp. CMMVII]|uniref:hypothetical protein n=1 Tax=Anaerobacillus sp. CMMVII TaxID=2755588 RepID=UPI0021B81EDE|nr:hypothetical protein [Anaerobacillus sp. CMMVII]MCT8139476.1 hypothetical protein [Anaerobacillus sp. CMMVII]